ncbi:MAG: hypothetical protein RIQ93_282 [Verrucomicrobiota bacterium]|jgi:hypothetical protein
MNQIATGEFVNERRGIEPLEKPLQRWSLENGPVPLHVFIHARLDMSGSRKRARRTIVWNAEVHLSFFMTYHPGNCAVSFLEKNDYFEVQCFLCLSLGQSFTGYVADFMGNRRRVSFGRLQGVPAGLRRRLAPSPTKEPLQNCALAQFKPPAQCPGLPPGVSYPVEFVRVGLHRSACLWIFLPDLQPRPSSL